LDQFYSGGDAIVEALSNGQPTGQSPLTVGGAVVSVSSFDTSGNYTLSGTPSSFPVALVYIFKIKAIDYVNLSIDNIMSMEQANTILGTLPATSGSIPFSSGASNTISTGNLNFNSSTNTLSGMNKITINNSVYPNTQLLFGTAVSSPYMFCAIVKCCYA